MSDHDGPRTSVEQVLAAFEQHGDRVALSVDDGEQVTYRSLLDRIHGAALRLDGLGVARGDVVALLTGDRPQTFVLRWAVNLLGAAVVVPPAGCAAPVLAGLLGTTGARFVVADEIRRQRAAGTAAAAGNGVRVVDMEVVCRTDDDGSPRVGVRARPEDTASISLTGGTTGTPKGVARRAAASSAFSPAATAGWGDTIQLLCTPVGHFGGTLALRVFAAGGRVVLQPGFDPVRVLAAIEAEHATMVFLLPRLLHRLLDEPRLSGADLSSLRGVYLGSAPCSARRLGEAVGRFGPIVAQGYGTTEATNICWLSAEDMTRPELRSTVGRPVPGVELEIRDDDGAPMPHGATGAVWVRTPGMMRGYLGDPDATAAVLRDGWLDTGDRGSVDVRGYLTLAGRTNDMIFSEYGHLYPGQIEQALLDHPDIASVSVFADRGPDGEECAAAAVVARPGRDPCPGDLAEHVRARLGSARVPSVVHLVDDLPVTATGKVDRDAVRRHLSRSPGISG